MRRRTVLKTAGVSSLLVLSAGCLGDVTVRSGPATPTPVDLSGDKLDDSGGMVIGRHGGPNGQIFYANRRPERHDNPAWFHTLSFGLFPYYFQHDQLGWEAAAIYATDYSTVDYTLSTRNGRPVISAPTAPETFANARDLTYVAESKVHGGMGPDLIPFTAGADAESFIAAHGGHQLSFDDITPEFLSRYLDR